MALHTHSLITILVTLSLVAVTLTGCLGDDAAGALDDADAQGNQSAAKPEITDNDTATPDGRGEIAAFKETNKTEDGIGGMHHRHDYWKGRDHVVLHASSYGMVPIPLLPEGAPPATAIGDFTPDEGKMVFEGTSHVTVFVNNVTLTPTQWLGQDGEVPPHPYINLNLWYLTPNDPADGWRDAGKITPGEPVVIPVEALETDMPHSVASLWVFRLFTDEPNGLFFDVNFTAWKGSDVVDWPPHPDLYADRSERVVLESEARTEELGLAQELLYGDNANWHEPEKIISWGTGKVVVETTIDAFDSPIPADEYILDVHNASTRATASGFGAASFTLKPTQVDGDTLTFEFEPDRYGFDSPYSTESRWGFRLRAIIAKCEGCHPYNLDYRIKATAFG